MIVNAGSPTLRGPGSRSRRSAQLWELVDRDGHFRAIMHERIRAAFEIVARAANGHGKAMGVGGVRQDFDSELAVAARRVSPVRRLRCRPHPSAPAAPTLSSCAI